ncbi:MAG: S1 RNA-binding domain-containing protein [Ruminococcaceae bacterium]|nr:S1 RNA-binding domain-containing protein [Oscillospiraceae bacterium]
MSIEVGSIVSGKVTGITNFGVFVELEEGKNGMVHISEVAATYVKEIREYVSVGQQVTVKVLSVAPDGKISLSMKQAAEGYRPGGRSDHRSPQRDRAQGRRTDRPAGGPPPEVEAPSRPAPEGFDEMLSRFMASSDEKISSMRRNSGDRRSSRRGPGSWQ